MFAKSLSIQSSAHSTEDLCLVSQDAAKSCTLSKKLVEILCLCITLFFAQVPFLPLLFALFLCLFIFYTSFVLFLSKPLLGAQLCVAHF